jgi:hypothetical protein
MLKPIAQPGTVRQIEYQLIHFNPQPANRNDLLGDKLRDGVAAILQTQRTQGLFVSRHQTFNVLRLEHSVLYQLVNSHRFRTTRGGEVSPFIKIAGCLKKQGTNSATMFRSGFRPDLCEGAWQQ